MMWDHPLGVGWNKAVEIYAQNYSPPEDGAAALNTNDYLMLGTQLGFPGLFCFVAYVGLCFRNRPHLTQLHLQPLSNPVGEGGVSPPAGSGAGIKSSSFTHHSSLQAACLAGTLTLLVAFWFDGGLFKLPTAVVFWILLELGTSNLTADRKPPTWP
jgi:O-antigen ligase